MRHTTPTYTTNVLCLTTYVQSFWTTVKVNCWLMQCYPTLIRLVFTACINAMPKAANNTGCSCYIKTVQHLVWLMFHIAKELAQLMQTKLVHVHMTAKLILMWFPCTFHKLVYKLWKCSWICLVGLCSYKCYENDHAWRNHVRCWWTSTHTYM